MNDWLVDTILECLYNDDGMFVIPQGDNEIVVTNRETLEMYVIHIYPAQAFVKHAK